MTTLAALVAWLECAGHERIYLVDNASTYPALLEYLDRSRHAVVRLSTNVGHLAPWTAGANARAGMKWRPVRRSDQLRLAVRLSEAELYCAHEPI